MASVLLNSGKKIDLNPMKTGSIADVGPEGIYSIPELLESIECDDFTINWRIICVNALKEIMGIADTSEVFNIKTKLSGLLYYKPVPALLVNSITGLLEMNLSKEKKEVKIMRIRLTEINGEFN